MLFKRFQSFKLKNNIDYKENFVKIALNRHVAKRKEGKLSDKNYKSLKNFESLTQQPLAVHILARTQGDFENFIVSHKKVLLTIRVDWYEQLNSLATHLALNSLF